MWKDFFYFSRRERQGILILIVLIAGVFIGKYLFTPQVITLNEDSSVELEVVDKATPSEEKPFSGQKTYPAKAKSYSPNRKQSKEPESRTYYQPPESNPELLVTQSYPKSDKLSEGMVIDLNSSDTTQLMKVPGIGSSFAKRIVGYRNILGGYYRLEQLQEVYGMYEELYEKILPYLTANTDSIRQLPVNSASIDRLKSHPYINFYQAKALIETRKKKGKLESINDISLLEEFTEEDRNRIAPYLGF